MGRPYLDKIIIMLSTWESPVNSLGGIIGTIFQATSDDEI